MSGRIRRASSKKSQQRKELAAAILSFGSFADMPCTWCFRSGKTCLMSEDSSRCAECVRRGRSCDGMFDVSSCKCFFPVLPRYFSNSSTVARANAAHDKVAKEAEEAEGAVLLLQEQMNQAFARLSRLREQKKFLHEKRMEMFRRGMQELDEEDGIEEQRNTQEEVEALGIVEASGGVVDWSTVDFLNLGPGPADPGSLGGTVVQAVDNVSNS
jgi:hypothetical protein